MKTTALLLAIFAGCAIARAEPVVRLAQPGHEPPPSSLDDVAWLEGRWQGQALGGTVTELYARTSKTQMIGMFTLAKDGEPVFHEFVILEERDGSLLFRIKHFNADFSEWERLGETVDMPLIELSESAAHFSGMSFIRTSTDAMQVQLLIEDDDEQRLEYFEYRRVGDGANKKGRTLTDAALLN